MDARGCPGCEVALGRSELGLRHGRSPRRPELRFRVRGLEANNRFIRYLAGRYFSYAEYRFKFIWARLTSHSVSSAIDS